MKLLAPILVLRVVAAYQLELSSERNVSGAQENATDVVDAAVARAAKMAAVKRVAKMLEDLQARVLQEGEEEVALYNKFSCFCKDTSADKSDAITTGETSQTTLGAKITSLDGERSTLDGQIESLEGDITQLHQDLKLLREQRATEVKTYKANQADIVGAVEALTGAIQSLRAAKNPSLAQWQVVAKTVREAAVMADALGLGGNQLQSSGVAFLIQEAPTVPTEAYSFKSDSIITTLEQLLVTFKGKKNEVDEAEVTAKHEFETVSQEKQNGIAVKTREVETKGKERQKKIADIASASEDLSVVSSTLLDDKAYLTELSQMCTDKAKTWDARSQVRTDELSALTEAIRLIKEQVSTNTSAATIRFAQQFVRMGVVAKVEDVGEPLLLEAEDAAERVEARQRSAPAAFFQELAEVRRLRGTPDFDSRKSIVDLLRSEGKHLQSTMLTSLASQIAEDPFTKVKVLIEELIERLLKQASNEATQKGWCDKSMAAAGQKRDFAAEEIRELNGNMAQLEALLDKLEEEITVLGTEIQDLTTDQQKADTERQQEKTENAAIVAEAKAGKAAVEEAIVMLDRFYKTTAKAEVDLTLLQRGPAADDAPDTGFDAGEAYTGAQDAAEGVLGLLEVISADFGRTVTETEAAEKQAVQDHLDFTTKTQSSIQSKTVAKNEKTTQKGDASGKFSEAQDELTTQTDLLKGAIEELIQLKATCVDTAMSFEDRIARRDEEIAALKKAHCMLTSHAQYGPDAAVSADC